MGLFSRFFGSPEARLMKRLARKANADVRTIYGPLNQLGLAIVAAASESHEALAEELCYNMNEPSHREVSTLYEFMFVYAHLALRTAFAKGFSEEQMTKLQNFLGPSLASCGVESFFGHWPDEHKSRATTEFFHNLNRSEKDYWDL